MSRRAKLVRAMGLRRARRRAARHGVQQRAAEFVRTYPSPAEAVAALRWGEDGSDDNG